jgi:hypothetical protein
LIDETHIFQLAGNNNNNNNKVYKIVGKKSFPMFYYDFGNHKAQIYYWFKRINVCNKVKS